MALGALGDARRLTEHEIQRRQLVRRAQGGWEAELACSCGWAVKVGPYDRSAELSDALAVAWEEHRRPGGN